MRLLKTMMLISFLLLLMILMQIPTYAGVSAGWEWRYQDGEQTTDNLKLDWELFPKWNVQINYGSTDEDLSLDIFRRTNTEGIFQPYFGLGVRDLLKKSEIDRSWPEKIEIVAGMSIDFGSSLFLMLDLKAVPNNLFDNDENDVRMEPRVSVSLNYRMSNQQRSYQSAPTPTPNSISQEDFDLLTRLVMAEAGNEPYEGQVAVAAVVLNRVESSQFPNSIREVVYQRNQFSSVPKLPYITPTESCRRAVVEALDGNDPSREALYFYNPKLSSKAGLKFFRSGKLRVTKKIGNHIFLVER